MDSSNQRIKCRNFLKSHDVGVIATATPDGQPHASVVNYFANNNMEVFFIAREDAQKYKNILVNTLADLVVCDENFSTSLEIKGIARKLDDSPQVINLLMKLSSVVRQKHSGPLPIMKHLGSELHLFCLQPGTITYADFSPSHANDGEYFEIDF